MIRQKSILFIGAGNLCWHLAQALHQKGIEKIDIASRNHHAANEVAQHIGGKSIRFEQLSVGNYDIVILSVSDSAIEVITRQHNFGNSLVLHCAGSVSLDILFGCSENYGVLYPLQTFTKGDQFDISNIPFFIEANNNDSLAALQSFAELLTTAVVTMNSAEREKLHLAAIVASNFSNHLYYLAYDYLEKNNISSDYLKPLILQTLQKINHIHPELAQTGTARRGNTEVINKHVQLLRELPGLRKIYKNLTKSILQTYQ